MAAVAWVRYLGHVVAIFLLLGPTRWRLQYRPSRPRLQWLRGVLMLASTLVFFSVLRLMPLAQATALNFCAPLFVVALIAVAARRSAWARTRAGRAGSASPSASPACWWWCGPAAN